MKYLSKRNRILFVSYNTLYLLCVGNNIVAEEYRVSSAAEIEALMPTVQPGDTLIMTNGTWVDQQIEFAAEGTEQDSIYLLAETPGQVIITGESNFRLSGKYLVVSGLYFRNGWSSTSMFKFSGSLGNATHCRLTQTSIVDYNPADVSIAKVWVSINGTHNRVDHCYFAGKTHRSATIGVAFDSELDIQPALYHRIDHNYFGYRPPLGTNGGETIRIGNSTYSMNNSRTVVEYNYFERCNGEAEIISNKSCENVYQYNTFYESEGALTLRHGARNTVQGNFFIGNKMPRTGGVRIVDSAQTVVNNYFEGLYGEWNRAAISFMNGIPDSPLTGYYQVKRALIAFNTFVDCRQSIAFGIEHSTYNTILPALDCIIANNIVKSDSTLITEYSAPINLTWEGNLMEGDLGITQPLGITLTDLNLFLADDDLWRIDETSPTYNSAVGDYPDIVEDMDGQPRDDQKDVGADEVSQEVVRTRPLTSADVGPDWLNDLNYIDGEQYPIIAADFIDHETGWVVGENVLIRTDDGGLTWDTPAPRVYQDIRLIDFINDSTGWAVDQGGTIFKTQDGGHSWSTQLVLPSHHGILSLDAVSNNLIYATGMISDTPFPYGMILKTTDSGLNWTDVKPSDDSTDYTSINFLNSDTGVVAGHRYSDGIILRTFDGGDTWDETIVIGGGQPNEETDDIQYVDDSTIFFLIGSDLYRSDGTLNSWTLKTDSVTSYYALDNTTVYVIKGDSIMKSVDSELLWTVQYSGNDDLFHIQFLNYSIGWAVGSSGTVLKTDDGGTNWIERSIIGTQVRIGDHSVSVPKGFVFCQNYPNPFNLVSTIRYELPRATEISLVVYDILGREVARLVEGYTEPGYHQTQWGGRDAAGREVPSGIYIAQLVTPAFTQSIKMVLLK